MHLSKLNDYLQIVLNVCDIVERASTKKIVFYIILYKFLINLKDM